MTGSLIRRARREALATQAAQIGEAKAPQSVAETQRAALIEDTARLYALVGEMNVIVNRLSGLGVVARFGGRASVGDPLAQHAVVELTMRTDMEPLPRGF